MKQQARTTDKGCSAIMWIGRRLITRQSKKDMSMLQTIHTEPSTCRGFVKTVTKLWIPKKGGGAGSFLIGPEKENEEETEILHIILSNFYC